MSLYDPSSDITLLNWFGSSLCPVNCYNWLFRLRSFSSSKQIEQYFIILIFSNVGQVKLVFSLYFIKLQLIFFGLTVQFRRLNGLNRLSSHLLVERAKAKPTTLERYVRGAAEIIITAYYIRSRVPNHSLSSHGEPAPPHSRIPLIFHRRSSPPRRCSLESDLFSQTTRSVFHGILFMSDPRCFILLDPQIFTFI